LNVAGVTFQAAGGCPCQPAPARCPPARTVYDALHLYDAIHAFLDDIWALPGRTPVMCGWASLMSRSCCKLTVR